MSFFANLRHAWSSLRHLFMFVVDHLVLLGPARCRSTSRDVLVVKPDKLGDFLVWLDAAQEYRRCFSGRKVVLLGDASWAELAQRIGWWDEVWPMDFGRFGNDIAYRLEWLLRVRRGSFSTVITTSRSLRYMDTLVRFSGAPEKIGPDGHEAVFRRDQEIRISNRWFTRVVSLKPRRTTTMLELNLELARAVGGRARTPSLPSLPEAVLTGGPASAIPDPYVIMVPGAAWAGRRWPLSRLAQLSDLILETSSCRIVLCGASAERQLGEEMIERISKGLRHRVVNRIGETDLSGLVALVHGASAVVTNETGTLHLAVASGAPAVCIAGGGDFGHLVPYPEDIETGGRPLPITVYKEMPCFGCGWICSQASPPDGPMPCIDAVSVEDVWSVLKDLLMSPRVTEIDQSPDAEQIASLSASTHAVSYQQDA